MSDKVKILDTKQIQQKINRLAYQVYENNFFEKEKSGVYLYGASLFSQILLGMGFNETYAISVLDNASYKWGERLYGTRLNVEPVSVLKSSAPINLVLRMGPYQSEIRNQILSINPNLRIFE